VRIGTAAPEVVTASVTVIAEDDRLSPEGFAFLPDGTALVATRGGRVVSIGIDGRVGVAVPGPSHGPGSGGLLSITVSPKYAVDRWIYLYFAWETGGHVSRLRLGQAPQEILTGIPGDAYHNCGQLAFGPDGLLYVVTCAVRAGRASNDDPGELDGKVLRITPDGKPAPGNPVPGSPIYSYEPVNGLAWDERGGLFGLRGTDLHQIHRIESGPNGSPAFPRPPAVVSRIATWPAPLRFAGAAAVLHEKLYTIGFYGTDPRGRLLRVDLDGKHPAEVSLAGHGPVRAIAAAPDGTLLVATAEPFAFPPGGRILRVTVP
jgi:glucose/arabinose dehydrogenase